MPQSLQTQPTSEIQGTLALILLAVQDPVPLQSKKFLMISASWGWISRLSLGLPLVPQPLEIAMIHLLLLDKLEKIPHQSVEQTQDITVCIMYYKEESFKDDFQSKQNKVRGMIKHEFWNFRLCIRIYIPWYNRISFYFLSFFVWPNFTLY